MPKPELPPQGPLDPAAGSQPALVRRFKVKDLLISPIPRPPGLLEDGQKVCAKNDPTTRVGCMESDDPKKNTSLACREGSDTEEPCGANGDTSWGCGDAATYLPCKEKEDTKPCLQAGDTCARGVPNAKDQTKYRCLPDSPEGPRTSVPCRGGSNTEVPGMPNDPWKGCLRGSGTKKPCAIQFETAKPCMEKGRDRTRYACWEDKDFGTKHPCLIGSDTKGQCHWIQTRNDCFPLTVCLVHTEWCPQAAETKNQGPYAGAGGLFDCPPLSQLELPPQDPACLDALAALHADLREALAMVEARQEVVKSTLTPATLGETANLERELEGALVEVRMLKKRLAGEPGDKPPPAEGPSGGPGRPGRGS